MREIADRSVDEAKKAFGQFIEATHQAVAKVEGSATSLSEGAADINRQALAFVEENISASFDLASKLVRARTVEEVAALQQEFLERQMAAAAKQGMQLSDMATRAMKKANK
jgi:phasin